MQRPVTTRRAALLLVVLGGCCDASFGWDPVPDLGSGFTPSCGTIAIGAGGGGGGYPGDFFTYACPPLPAADAGLALDASSIADLLVSGSDPACVLPFYPGLNGLPTVAVGAPFQLQYIEAELPDASVTLPVTPAVATLAVSSDAGVALPQPGYLAFFAWQGSQVYDVTHMLARTATSLGLFSGLPGGPPLGSLGDGGTVEYRATQGSTALLLAYPQADDGTLLGGTIGCAFASSDPTVVAVEAQGVTALMTPLSPGEATVSVVCRGMQAVATVSVTAGPAGSDGAGEGASDATPVVDASGLDSGALEDADTPGDAADVDGQVDPLDGRDAASPDAEGGP